MLELERLLLSLLAPPQRLNLVLGSLNASNMFDIGDIHAGIFFTVSGPELKAVYIKL